MPLNKQKLKIYFGQSLIGQTVNGKTPSCFCQPEPSLCQHSLDHFFFDIYILQNIVIVASDKCLNQLGRHIVEHTYLTFFIILGIKKRLLHSN